MVDCESKDGGASCDDGTKQVYIPASHASTLPILMATDIGDEQA